MGDAGRLASLFVADFYCEVDAVRDAAERRGVFNIIHNETIVKVDFIVRKDSPYRAEEMRRRRLVDAGGARIWLVAPEDLLLSKLYWAKDSRSEVQLRDVRNLIASQAGLDWAYIRAWAQELSVSALLDEVRT